MQGFGMAVLEILERFIKTENFRAAERTDENGHGGILPEGAEIMEHPTGQRPFRPLLAGRPIQDDLPFRQPRQNGLFDIVLPMRAVRIHIEQVDAPGRPPQPGHGINVYGADGIEYANQ